MSILSFYSYPNFYLSQGLTVLEYLVGHGSERVIDDIREHAYQISVHFSYSIHFNCYFTLALWWPFLINRLSFGWQTLSDFQYIDSNGRDQGNNVRKKSQNLVALVNDKERIIEVRQKAAANRDKWVSSQSLIILYFCQIFILFIIFFVAWPY